MSSPPNKPVQLEYAAISEIGMRSSNQDHIGLAQRDGLRCFVVADGAGGHHGGEIASRVVVDALLARFDAEASFGPPRPALLCGTRLPAAGAGAPWQA
ncbi:protein phosphatase 2C domain-containing protein [Massilia sp. Se16.2.3]|uniref:protein phosphatase 2C domain-containing protein n=1 Tax=Massilia sp. Se16.2.3 TaxID=2709303 RepID=UPI001602966A|nr:protein phosphatase 2C domain-containing protein [Massilia sp. Se16.2.3]QNB00580.1 hypothetical protein G4G31_20180 [Massilia sp. Se16.2.3]